MAHGLNSVLKRGPTAVSCKSEGKTGAGSRRIFAPHFKLQVLDSYRHDADCKGNQRATARKYGIHRRQIQKWLQVENNLRSTVCKGKSECSSPVDNRNNNSNDVKRYGIEMALRIGRLRDASSSPQRDGVKQTEVRVPAPSQFEVKAEPVPAPLDFTTHSRSASLASPTVATDCAALPPPHPDSPMDLSFKKIAPGLLCFGAPVPCGPLSTPPSLTVQPHPDVWDLSTKRKLEVTCLSPTDSYEESPKAVKLFKPYLDDLNKESSSSSSSSSSSLSSFDECPPPCCSMPLTPPTMPSDYYYYNHNNNVCEIKAECTYTIHELQPKSTLNCCYPYPTAYPVPDYDPNGYYCSYEDTYSPSLTPLKQRQSYSLDFKLKAIDCYYEDSTCKGNQRAVANKYNIHRRQVQKWLKQEEELRHRNEIVRQTELLR
ncbi:hypothetical protein WA026_011664 [Henosepilachna vigintioctopunctata]|uniref:Brinker DNA-binding domain-containing protein n=1 Tax=Henosepilachna vigintioctopunctata TaxID=420089 RepID=A0AAW1TSK5_9CUCU